MKGGGKNATRSDAINGDAGGDADNGTNYPLALFRETDQTHVAKHEGDEAQASGSEGESTDGEEGVEEEVKEDGDKVLEEVEGPKLDEGFYEIEAIRRRRIRKGQLQYLIKWRGWPETANTWEPLENLQSCSDVIDAFEESLRSGRPRKRRRKNVVVHPQPKKRQQRSTIASYSIAGVGTSSLNKHLSSDPLSGVHPTGCPSLPQTLVSYREGQKNADAVSPRNVKQADQNGCLGDLLPICGRKEENEYDPKLSDLKVITSTNGIEADKLAIKFEEAKASDGNSHMNAHLKDNCAEPVQSRCCRGAKRRKSGSVKRFKKDPYSPEPVGTPNAPRISDSCGTDEQSRTEVPEFAGNSFCQKNKTDDSKNAPSIIKIVKPIGYSASVSSSIQDILVTFTAMRSDGTEVMVDNKFLKAHNPLLLINFYEQHIRYTPLS